MLKLMNEEEFVGKAVIDLPPAIQTYARILRSGEARTMDYKPTRLNLVLNEDQVVVRAFYG
jgi:hypothetical protein